MRPAVRNRLIIGAAAVAAAVFLGYQMYYSQTPPRHADHDHAMAKIDAGGFLWVKGSDGKRRNLVGKPGKVVLLHWFDPADADHTQQQQAARFAAAAADDPMIEVLFIADAPSWEGLESWAAANGVPISSLYLDEKGQTADLIGVRRLPETLIYDPNGILAFQARGPMGWSPARLKPQLEQYKGGVEEMH